MTDNYEPSVTEASNRCT